MALQKAQLDNPSPKSSGEKLPWEGELIVPSAFKISVETSDAFVENPFFEEPAIVTPQMFTEKETLLEIPFEEATDDSSKDTLPSNAKIKNILEMINHLSDEEKIELADQFVLLPEWINLVFRAIANQLATLKD